MLQVCHEKRRQSPEFLRKLALNNQNGIKYVTGYFGESQ